MSKSLKLIRLIESLDESVDVRYLGIDKDVLYITINGVKYGYKAVAEPLSEIDRKFRKMLTFSAGKALTWLKKVAQHVYGGSKGTKIESRAGSRR